MFIEELKNTTENLAQDSRIVGWEFNMKYPEYEFGVLNIGFLFCGDNLETGRISKILLQRLFEKFHKHVY